MPHCNLDLSTTVHDFSLPAGRRQPEESKHSRPCSSRPSLIFSETWGTCFKSAFKSTDANPQRNQASQDLLVQILSDPLGGSGHTQLKKAEAKRNESQQARPCLARPFLTFGSLEHRWSTCHETWAGSRASPSCGQTRQGELSCICMILDALFCCRPSLLCIQTWLLHLLQVGLPSSSMHKCGTLSPA